MNMIVVKVTVWSITMKNRKHGKRCRTNLIRNDVLWIFPSNCPTHEQTIRLYTSEVPNGPGKYRIYKSFNGNTKVAYAGFKMVDKKGIEQSENESVSII